MDIPTYAIAKVYADRKISDATSTIIDTSLQKSGFSADAKIVGDKLTQLENNAPTAISDSELAQVLV